MNRSSKQNDTWQDRTAWSDFGVRTTVLVQGEEAVSFVDNFTTAALSQLQPGQGSEAFFTDNKGRVLVFAVIMRLSNGLMIDAEKGYGRSLCDHLSHYHIREKLEFFDCSDAWRNFLLVGKTAMKELMSEAEACRGASLAGEFPEQLFSHAEWMFGGVKLQILRTDWWGDPGWIIRCQENEHSRVVEWFQDNNVIQIHDDALEVARIEQGTPSIIDITEKTLPQELVRNERAISFNKGCYLGQETVARLDALGHVNRKLTALSFEGQASRGEKVFADGEHIGNLSSCCFSPQLGCCLGLGILPTRIDAAKKISVDGMDAKIRRVPL